MLLYCRKCGKKMPSELDICGHCGSPRYDGPDELLTHKLPPAPGKAAARPAAVLEDDKGKAATGGLARLFGRKKSAVAPEKPASSSPVAGLFQRKDKTPPANNTPVASPTAGKAGSLAERFSALLGSKGQVADKSVAQAEIQPRAGILSGKASAVRPERVSVLAPAAPDKAILQPSSGAALLGKVSGLLRFSSSGAQKGSSAVSREVVAQPSFRDRLLALFRKGK